MGFAPTDSRSIYLHFLPSIQVTSDLCVQLSQGNFQSFRIPYCIYTYILTRKKKKAEANATTTADGCVSAASERLAPPLFLPFAVCYPLTEMNADAPSFGSFLPKISMRVLFFHPSLLPLDLFDVGQDCRYRLFPCLFIVSFAATPSRRYHLSH